ncbi:MAG: hypothetical protein ABIF40_00065 [archaeon]
MNLQDLVKGTVELNRGVQVVEFNNGFSVAYEKRIFQEMAQYQTMNHQEIINIETKILGEKAIVKYALLPIGYNPQLNWGQFSGATNLRTGKKSDFSKEALQTINQYLVSNDNVGRYAEGRVDKIYNDIIQDLRIRQVIWQRAYRERKITNLQNISTDNSSGKKVALSFNSGIESPKEFDGGRGLRLALPNKITIEQIQRKIHIFRSIHGGHDYYKAARWFLDLPSKLSEELIKHCETFTDLNMQGEAFKAELLNADHQTFLKNINFIPEDF